MCAAERRQPRNQLQVCRDGSRGNVWWPSHQLLGFLFLVLKPSDLFWRCFKQTLKRDLQVAVKFIHKVHVHPVDEGGGGQGVQKCRLVIFQSCFVDKPLLFCNTCMFRWWHCLVYRKLCWITLSFVTRRSRAGNLLQSLYTFTFSYFSVEGTELWIG